MFALWYANRISFQEVSQLGSCQWSSCIFEFFYAASFYWNSNIVTGVWHEFFETWSGKADEWTEEELLQTAEAVGYGAVK